MQCAARAGTHCVEGGRYAIFTVHEHPSVATKVSDLAIMPGYAYALPAESYDQSPLSASKTSSAIKMLSRSGIT